MDPVRAISLACLCALLLGLVLTWQTDQIQSWLIIPPVLVGAATYIFAPQLRWWSWQRNPPDLPTELAPLLERFPFYRRLNLEDKREFRRRTFLIREATVLEGKAIEDIPADIGIMVAASLATVTFHREEFLIDGVETVVFYRHVFPSPEYDQLHCTEFYGPDGAIIWTLNIFLRSVVESDKFLQLGIYEWSRALMYTDPEMRAAMEPVALDYAAINKVSGFSEAALKEFIGLEELDREAITIVLYFTHHDRMRQLEEGTFTACSNLFS